MKHILSILAFILIFSQCAHAQNFAFASQPRAQGITYYSAGNFADFRGERRRLGPATITGGIVACVGFATTIVGGLVYLVDDLVYYDPNNSSSPNVNTGLTIIEIGGGLAAAGCIVGITGLIMDRSRGDNRWGVVAPKPNQVGLAYNF